MKKLFTGEQILDLLKQAEAGVSLKELCRQHGFSDASFYTWRAKFGGMTVRWLALEGWRASQPIEKSPLRQAAAGLNVASNDDNLRKTSAVQRSMTKPINIFPSGLLNGRTVHRLLGWLVDWSRLATHVTMVDYRDSRRAHRCRFLRQREGGGALVAPD